jgi:Putative polyhydroxyalkanoic acid system protein (PHA_gran_rgn)
MSVVADPQHKTGRERCRQARRFPHMLTPTEPIIVTISHRLGRDGAKRRIEDGLAAIRAEVTPYVKTLDYQWDDQRLDFRVVAMMQTITGRIEVYEDFVKVELGLPRLLHLLAKQIAGRIENRAATLLEGPKGKG